MPRYTKTQRKLMHELFKKAKGRLATSYVDFVSNDHKQKFLCYALADAGDYNDDYYLCVDLIAKRLGKHVYLEQWLTSKGYLTFMIRAESWNKVQATRVAWLNSLIEEFSR